ncbi:glycoside hydrolase family 5 protein [Catalinimonas niigatensis]|uniref:glycoside hydrolase family 5 protein n=1 Tax=Catalinimonas niigatensis TaxID=1397264 RepID=UPI00266627C4|nr:glycoside hydrolase family 5 protein [Catalinimonas niigatensis]WPP51329.1 glycoside hydrolase family 5 protein [Catalinimonas niigatensis]
MHYLKPSLLLLLPCTILFCCNTSQEEVATDRGTKENEYADFQIHKGTNISHWLSQSEQRGEERVQFFQQDDVEYLAGLGFDHLRFPVDEEQMFDEAGNKEAEAFQLLHNALGWCQENGLRAIVDLHILRSHHFNEKEKPLWTDPTAQEKFIQLWQSFSEELSEYPNGMLAYELMNEPVADDPAQWNQLVAKAFAAIRALEPERTIVIGSNRWQSADTFDALEVPENDENILLSFHFYEPFLLTHYQASWTDLADYTGPVHYPGQIVTEEELEALASPIKNMAESRMRTYNQDTLEYMMRKPLRVAQEKGLPLYCGEWGVIEHAPDEARQQWYRDMIHIFEKNNIAYANWDYKSNSFGLINSDESVNDELVQIISSEK